MKRFINLIGQGTGHVFAWFDIVYDRIEAFNGIQAFNTWDEFEEALKKEYACYYSEKIQQYKALCPDWAKNIEDRNNIESPAIALMNHMEKIANRGISTGAMAEFLRIADKWRRTKQTCWENENKMENMKL